MDPPKTDVSPLVDYIDGPEVYFRPSMTVADFVAEREDAAAEESAAA